MEERIPHVATNSVNRLPQGISEAHFNEISDLVRTRANDMGLGDDIFVQGSRAAGTARPTSDLDLAIRLSPEDFDNFLFNQSKLSNVNPASASERTLLHAIDTGKIQAGEARLSPLRRQLEGILNMEVDLSVIRAGGKFDSGAQLPLIFPKKP